MKSTTVLNRGPDPDTSKVPKTRRAKAIYQHSPGLSTTLEFPQQFTVSLSGEQPLPASSSSNVLRSLCNHAGCVFNFGTLAERRERFVKAIALIDAVTSPPAPTPTSEALVSSASSPISGDILDSGAARHVEPSKSRFTDLSACTPVTLM